MGRPSGDPGAMRREADELLKEAERIRGSARSTPEVPREQFSAPAGTRLHNRLGEIRDEGLRAASIVDDAAHTLQDEARRLEDSIRQWEDEQRRQQQKSARR